MVFELNYVTFFPTISKMIFFFAFCVFKKKHNQRKQRNARRRNRENREDENRKYHSRNVIDANLHFLLPKLPLNSQRPPDASIVHYSCSANDKVVSSPAKEIRKGSMLLIDVSGCINHWFTVKNILSKSVTATKAIRPQNRSHSDSLSHQHEPMNVVVTWWLFKCTFVCWHLCDRRQGAW